MKSSKRLKRILLVTALLLTVIALFLGGSVVLVRGTPDYYKPIALTREQIEAASQSAEQTLTRMQNLAAESHGAQIRAANSTTTPTTAPADSNTFTFSQDELNALFQKWAQLPGWRADLDRVVADPIIILQPNRVILAGRSKLRQLETIVSMHFEPRIDGQGKFDLNLTSVMAGKLPLPQDTLVGALRERALAALQQRIGYWQERARIEPTGIANSDAMYASLSKLLIREFNHEPDQAVLFIPSGRGFVPVKLTHIAIAEQSITFSVVPYSVDEQSQLLEEIRKPTQ